MDPEDSWQQHAADTLREPYWLANPRTVELLCREASAAIEDLVRCGAQFAREDDGRLTQPTSALIATGAPASPATTPAARSADARPPATELGVALRDDV